MALLTILNFQDCFLSFAFWFFLFPPSFLLLIKGFGWYIIHSSSVQSTTEIWYLFINLQEAHLLVHPKLMKDVVKKKKNTGPGARHTWFTFQLCHYRQCETQDLPPAEWHVRAFQKPHTVLQICFMCKSFFLLYLVLVIRYICSPFLQYHCIRVRSFMLQ